LVVLPGGIGLIGLIGLVVHGRFGTPTFARQTLTGQRAAAGQDCREVNCGSVLTEASSPTLGRRCDHR